MGFIILSLKMSHNFHNGNVWKYTSIIKYTLSTSGECIQNLETL